jgi:flagellar FliL protein
MSDETEAAKPQEEATPKKGKGKLVAIAVAAVMVLAGGGGAFWWFTRGAHAASETTPKRAAAEEGGGGVVPLETFLVNLADKSGSRYLKTTLKLVVPDEKTAEKLAKNEVAVTRARSAILELLTTKTADELVTAEGKSALKKAICERVSPLVGAEVTDVLFVDFVVQF